MRIVYRAALHVGRAFEHWGWDLETFGRRLQTWGVRRLQAYYEAREREEPAE